MFGASHERAIMLDHFGFVVRNLETSVRFYENCLAHLGLKIIERHDYGAVIFARSQQEEFPFIWIGTGRPSFWKENQHPGQSPIHLCFKAKNKTAVDLFYQNAIEFGGIDNGKPGERDPGYYAAYVIDPDGNNIEAGYRE
ncbi:MAG: VOC family protein [Bdellovibrionaceae bacterium]|nr:VOC family protein [Pseudobdellovibrionaceae bacterium]